jgi:hypothetical protein
MAVGDTLDDKPDRPESAAGPHPPCPHRDAGHKERPATADSSADEDEDAIERPSLDRGGPDVLDHEKKTNLSRVQSRHGSSFVNTETDIVPRDQRRGLLGRLTLIPEVERPYEYKDSTKWMITAIVALAAAGAPMGSSIFMREWLLLRTTDLSLTAVSCPPQHVG